MNKKYYIIGGILAVLVIALVAMLLMGGGEKKPVNKGQIELTWWKTFEESENVTEIISEYEKTHKNVRITFVKKDINDYESDLLDAIASGKTPDIFSIHNDWLPKHLEKLSPMPQAMMNLRTYKDTFVDVAAADFVKDDKIYAMPLATDVLALYYNKDILGSAGISIPPKTWPELVADVEKITVQTKPGEFTRSGIAMGTGNNVNRAVDLLSLLMLQNGTKFYSDDFGYATFDQQVESSDGQRYDAGQNALQFFTQFADTANKSYTWNSKADYSVDAFTQSKVAMMLSYFYIQPQIKSKAPNLNWGVVAVPQTSLSVTKVNFANYWGEGVSKFTPNPQQAWDFLIYLTSKENLEKYYSKHRLPASRKDIIVDQINNETLGIFAESALTAKSVYKKDPSVFEAVFIKMIDDVILRNFTPEEAISNGVQQMNLNLNK